MRRDYLLRRIIELAR